MRYLNYSDKREMIKRDGNRTKGSALFGILAFAFKAQYRYISNFQYYNYSLNLQQISTLRSEGLGGIPVNLTHLTSWFPLSNDVKDHSGNNNNFTYANLTFTKSYNYT